jgi:hypothetical protein
MKRESKVENTHLKETWAVNKGRLDKLLCNYQNLNSIYSELFRMSLRRPQVSKQVEKSNHRCCVHVTYWNQTVEDTWKQYDSLPCILRDIGGI